jgi:hypothetical protein
MKKSKIILKKHIKKKQLKKLNKLKKTRIFLKTIKQMKK